MNQFRADVTDLFAVERAFESGDVALRSDTSELVRRLGELLALTGS